MFDAGRIIEGARKAALWWSIAIAAAVVAAIVYLL